MSNTDNFNMAAMQEWARARTGCACGWCMRWLPGKSGLTMTEAREQAHAHGVSETARLSGDAP